MNSYGEWLPRKGVEVMVTDKPRVLYVRNERGIIALPLDVAKNFESIDQIVEQFGPYLEDKLK